MSPTVDPNAPKPPQVEPHLWLATFETRNFDFTSLATTRAGAVKQIEDGWKAHCREYVDADPQMARQAALDGEINVQPVRVGDCLRVGSLIHFTTN